jgi:hypothetical protein
MISIGLQRAGATIMPDGFGPKVVLHSNRLATKPGRAGCTAVCNKAKAATA